MSDTQAYLHNLANHIQDAMAIVCRITEYLGVGPDEQERIEESFARCINELTRLRKSIAAPVSHETDELITGDQLIELFTRLKPTDPVQSCTFTHSLKAGTCIRGPLTYLQEVVTEIKRNAAKAGSTILKTHISDKDNIIIIYMLDNGIGMTAKQLQEVGVVSYETETSGYGIRIVKDLVHTLGGSIKWASFGLGTRVILTLAKVPPH